MRSGHCPQVAELIKGSFVKRQVPQKLGRAYIKKHLPAMAESRRQQLLAKSWTAVAMEYERRLAPLFQPWISQLVTLFTSQTLPEGAIYAPACGPGVCLCFILCPAWLESRRAPCAEPCPARWAGEELVLLAQALPGHHQIVGADLAQGMVDLTQQRIAQMTHARCACFLPCNQHSGPTHMRAVWR